MLTEQPTKCFVQSEVVHVKLVLALRLFITDRSRAVVCCGSLLPVLGVRGSVTFHLMCVHIMLSSVWVAEWPPFGK